MKQLFGRSAVLLLLLTGSAWRQSVSGSMSGTFVDPSNQMVPRTRQPGMSDNTGAMDTERQNYIGHGSDRGTFEESNRNPSPSSRQESGNDFRNDNSANRGSF